MYWSCSFLDYRWWNVQVVQNLFGSVFKSFFVIIFGLFFYLLVSSFWFCLAPIVFLPDQYNGCWIFFLNRTGENKDRCLCFGIAYNIIEILITFFIKIFDTINFSEFLCRLIKNPSQPLSNLQYDQVKILVSPWLAHSNKGFASLIFS